MSWTGSVLVSPSSTSTPANYDTGLSAEEGLWTRKGWAGRSLHARRRPHVLAYNPQSKYSATAMACSRCVSPTGSSNGTRPRAQKVK